MRITRFRVASMIAILGCGAAWAAASRAQTNSQAGVPNPTDAPHPMQSVPPQVRELSVPLDAQPSPARRKQVIDLRDRIASNPNAVRGQAVSADQSLQQTQRNPIQQTPNSPSWVDAAIPNQVFDQAQMAPRQVTGGNGAIASELPSNKKDANSPNQRMVPRELAPPEGPKTNSAEQISSYGGSSFSTDVRSNRQTVSIQDAAETAIASPENGNAPKLMLPEPSPTASQKNLPEVVGLKDAMRSNAVSKEVRQSNEDRSPQPTFTPGQAIPLSIDVPESQELPVNTKPTAQRSEGTRPIRPESQSSTVADSPIKVKNEAFSSSGDSGRLPSVVSPGQTIPDWIYGQAGAQPPPVEPSAAGKAQPNRPSPVTDQPGTESYGLTPQQFVPQSQQATTPSPQVQMPNSGAGRLTQPPLAGSSVPLNGSETKSSNAGQDNSKSKPDHTPRFALPASHPPELDPLSAQVGFCPGDFSNCSGPMGSTFDPNAASHVYRGKFAITTQRPLVELWRPLYTGGVYAPAPTWFGLTNPMKPHFMVYGDMRTAVGVNHNSTGKSNVWGNVLNLDMDLQLTSTERIHAFVSPLNNGTQASGVSFNEQVDLVNGTNFNFNTLFFEGDAGAMLGGARGEYPPFDLPFTFGLIPLVYQNGIWANDAMLGAAVALPARHSRMLKWSNFDATMFWATDNVSTDAFPARDSAADVFGTAWFIDAYEGYIEADYAFVNDNTGSNLGYHNFSMAFTRRYLSKISNSVRFIVNAGQQDLAPINRTADGHLLLIENSLISAYPNTVVPYVNFFYGQGRPQSLARAAIAGGILNNTGINFETDGMTGYPTLDPTGSNTYGFASGINILGSQFAHQLVLEFAMLQATGSRQFRNAAGDEYGLGVRYQKPLSHNLIFRTDHMVGFREEATNITGSRFELRWKF